MTAATVSGSPTALDALVRAFSEAALDAVIVTDVAGRIVHWSALATGLFGWDPDEVLGRTVAETLVPPTYRPLHERGVARYAACGRSSMLGRRLKLQALRKDGREVPIELCIRRVDADSTTLLVAFVRDLSSEARAQARTSEAEAFASSVLASLDSHVAVIARDGTILAVNERWRRFASENGASPDAVGVGRSYLEVCAHATSADAPVARQAHVGILAILDGVREHFALEYACDAPDQRRWFQMVATPLQPPWKGAVVAHTDVTERRLMEEALRAPARADPLTGLPNRVLFRDRLEQALLQRQRDGGRCAVLFIDLDRFKQVNDTLGHAAGDTLLCEVGRRFQERLRKTDTVARFGGDEFVVLLPDVRGGESAAGVARKLLESFEAPFVWEGHSIQAGASIGIVVAPDHGEDDATLLRRADVAMYAAKRARCEFALYVPDDDPDASLRLSIASDLRVAASQGQLFLVFQPIIDVRTGACPVVETLVRWQHPHRGLLEPKDFVPLAQQGGAMRNLSSWILGEAIRACSSWRDSGLACGVAVNLAADDLADRGLPHRVRGLLECWRMPAELLTLELNERAGMPEPGLVGDVMRELDAMGVRLSIDDFGSGSTRLHELETLVIDEVKLSGLLLRDADRDPKAGAELRRTVDLARRLGVVVVAECVERQEQLDLVVALGCEMAQGVLFSRPRREKDLQAWLLTRRPAVGSLVASGGS